MGHIQKRGDRYQARYNTPDGGERSQRFDLKRDAERWLALNGADQARGLWVDPRLGQVLFADWAEGWEETTVGNRPSTRPGTPAISGPMSSPSSVTANSAQLPT